MRAIIIALLLILSRPVAAASHSEADKAITTQEWNAEELREEQPETLLDEAHKLLHDDPASAIALAGKAYAHSMQRPDSITAHHALGTVAAAQWSLGLHPEHQETVLQALALSRELGLAHLMARDLQGLAQAYRYSGRMKEAVEESRNALALLLPTKDEDAIIAALIHLMGMQMAAGAHRDALELGRQAEERCLRREDHLGVARVRIRIAEVLADQGKWGDALPVLNQAMRTLDTVGTAQDAMRLHVLHARVQLGMGRATDALRSVEHAQALLPEAGGRRFAGTLRELRYGIALEQGQWRQALLLLQDIKAERDSLHSATSSQQMAAMQARYQVERMGSDNDVLREQLALNEHLMTRERRANTLLAIAAFVFLFLVVVLFFSARESLRAARRLRMKSAVVERQTQEIHTKNLELERQNMRLREALLGEEEKELMLKEIHHRVKNNLQIVDSLLQLQRSQSEVPGADRLFREAQGRIRSMALVHEQIYRAGELDRADPVGYLERLARNVVSSFGHMGDVRVDVHGSCPELPITTLIPLGLLVNELLTNSAKHAIGPGSTGAIGITIHEGSDGLLLEYTDGGGERSPGMREGGFGMQLVVALVEQLEGRLEDDGARSGCFRLVFHPVQNQLRKVG